MRTDKNLGDDVLQSSGWQDEKPNDSLTYNVFETVEENGQKRIVMNSLSGWERNHVFMNRSGKFDDLSLVSGMDSDADTRAHVNLDFNRDGYSDVAIVNGTKPQLQLFRNRLGKISKSKSNMIAVKLVGGNSTDQATEEWSCRDAVGTVVELSSGDMSYARELRFGEGFAGQNSSTLILGLGEAEQASLKVNWISGKSQEISELAAGSLVTIFENPAESKDESGIDVTEYLVPQQSADETDIKLAAYAQLSLDEELSDNNYYLVTSMATWCTACKKMAPQLQLLKEHFGGQVGLIGLPNDPDESREKLDEYQASAKPAYEIHVDASDDMRDSFSQILTKRRGKAAMPSTLLIDREGRVIEAWLGVPSISEVATIVTPSISH